MLKSAHASYMFTAQGRLRKELRLPKKVPVDSSERNFEPHPQSP